MEIYFIGQSIILFFSIYQTVICVESLEQIFYFITFETINEMVNSKNIQ